MLPLEIDTKKRNKFSVFRPVEKESKALKPNPKTNLIKTNFDASSSSLRSARGNKTSVHVKTKMMKQNHSLLLPPPCWRRCPNLNTRILIDFIPSRENENLDYHDELSFKATSFKTPTFVRWFRAFGSARVEWSELNQSIKTLFFFFAFQLWPTTNHKVYEDPYSKHTFAGAALPGSSNTNTFTSLTQRNSSILASTDEVLQQARANVRVAQHAAAARRVQASSLCVLIHFTSSCDDEWFDHKKGTFLGKVFCFSGTNVRGASDIYANLNPRWGYLFSFWN